MRVVNMPPTRKEIIIKRALEILDANPKGIRYSELVSQIAASLPEIPKNTVHGNVWNLDAVVPAQVYKPAKGVWKSAKYREPAEAIEEVTVAPPTLEVTLREEQFYEPFATSSRLFRKQLPADCVGRGGLGTQLDVHRETETPKASQVMVSTTFPPPLFGCLFGAKKWHTSFQHAVKNDQHMMSHRDNRAFLATPGC
jgi:hypothetical protein